MNPLHKIVVVDDEAGVLLALRLLMETLGFSVKDFPSGEKAVEFLMGDNECDLVICDLRMPKLSGLGVLEKVRAARPNMPFVLISGHATDEEVEKAKSLGAWGFLAKPFSADDLKNMVAKLRATASSAS